MNIQEPSANTQTRLESWKEIGAYLQRDSTTARRWEKEEGLPVHRHSHKSRSSVYAYPSEIDAWRVGRKVAPEPAPPRPLWKIPAFAVTMLLCLVMVGNGIRPVSAQTKQTARQVWIGEEVQTDGSVSGDGRFLSFRDLKTGNLAIRDLTTGENHLLTTDSKSWENGFAEGSSLSADGRQVAYTWSPSGANESYFELRVIPTTGAKAAARVVYQNKDFSYMTPVGWLPDGSGFFAYLSRRDQTHQIALVRSDGSGATVLRSFDWRSSNKLSVSPNGRYIAYDFPPNEDNLEHDIYILAADGSSEVRVVQSSADDLMLDWTPDEKALLFASDRTGGLGLWSIAVADGKAVGQPALLKKDIGKISSLGVSSKGTLYYSMATGVRGIEHGIADVYTVSIDPKTLKPLSEPALVAQRFLGANSGADWSPDGKYLAYASKRGSAWDSPSVLTIHSLIDGTEHDVMTKLAYILTYQGIRWSPDGLSIYVSGADRKGQEGLYRVDAQTSVTTFVTRGRTSPPLWSADGHTIYFRREQKIMALDARDNTEREIYPGPTSNYVTISPDGKTLAFAQGPDIHSKMPHILALPTDGGNPRVLAEGAIGGGYWLLQWTPDGESLLFYKNATKELWRASVRTGELTLVSKLPTEPNAGRISPDGRHFSYTLAGYVSEVWALANFIPAK